MRHIPLGTEKNHNNLIQGNWYHKQDSNRLTTKRKTQAMTLSVIFVSIFKSYLCELLGVQC